MKMNFLPTISRENSFESFTPSMIRNTVKKTREKKKLRKMNFREKNSYIQTDLLK